MLRLASQDHSRAPRVTSCLGEPVGPRKSCRQIEGGRLAARGRSAHHQSADPGAHVAVDRGIPLPATISVAVDGTTEGEATKTTMVQPPDVEISAPMESSSRNKAAAGTNAEAVSTAHTKAPSTARTNAAVSAHTEAAASHPMTTHTAAVTATHAAAVTTAHTTAVTAPTMSTATAG